MKKFLLYGLNGAVNTLVTYGIYVLLCQIMDYRIAIVLVYAIGIAISYILNGVIVFGRPGHLWRFIAIYLCMLGLNMSITASLVSVHWSPELAQIPAIGVAFVVGFLLNKRYAFAPREVLRASSEE